MNVSYRFRVFSMCAVAAVLTVRQVSAQASPAVTIDLSTSKQLLLPTPGAPQRLNSLPVSTALSPDGRWLVMLNAGYGTLESQYDQSLAVLDTQSGNVRDFPEARTLIDAKQTLFRAWLSAQTGNAYTRAWLHFPTRPEKAKDTQEAVSQCTTSAKEA